ncbi:MAG: hypothetical protein PUC06_06250 [Oscillospiraceae bacterium]|nr:hypothetical protein [Oscillospiraceae bacterium]
MERKAENVVQNIGAVAETVSIFYNSIAKQVPKDVALVLTQHFMDLTIVHRPSGNVNAAAIAAAIQAAEAQKRARRQPSAPQKPADSENHGENKTEPPGKPE